MDLKKPPRVHDIDAFRTYEPPARSARCAYWEARLAAGSFVPNGRIRGMGYSEKAEFYGVYVWEYFNVLSPLVDQIVEDRASAVDGATRLAT